jgi:3-dehydroquinate synthase
VYPPLKTVRFALGARAYNVQIGAGTIDAAAALAADAGLNDAGAYAIVGDRAAGAALERTAQALRATGKPVHEIVLDVSESSKSMAGLDALYGRFIDAKLDRSGVVVAVGGGVIGDLAGYAAATFLRGVRYIGIPTTLLAAVDSSVGGKTAINHARGKNLIGAIHQPSLVIVDRTAFASLPRREFVSGYGEMIKYGLALDARLWDELIALDPSAVGDAQIERCIALKAAIVAADERDEKGIRETLNFGHTIGHALEAATDYAYYRHGEAVVVGMRAAVHLSAARSHCSPQLADAVDAELAGVPVPALPALDTAAIVAAVGRDKKRAGGGATRFVLLRAIGETVGDAGVDAHALQETLAFLKTAYVARS